MILHRLRRDFRADRAELQTMTAGCSEPWSRDLEGWSISLGHTEQPGEVGHPAHKKGTMGASGMLNIKGEALEGVVCCL